MGDCLRAGELSHYVTSHLGQLSLAIPPWVGAVSTGMVTATAREEKGEPLRPGLLVYWPSSWLKAMVVKLSQSVSYTGLIGFNPRRLKGLKGDELPRNGPSCLCEIFFFFFNLLHRVGSEFDGGWASIPSPHFNTVRLRSGSGNVVPWNKNSESSCGHLVVS